MLHSRGSRGSRKQQRLYRGERAGEAEEGCFRRELLGGRGSERTEAAEIRKARKRITGIS